MGFEKFGRISFAAQSKLGDFVSNLEQGKVTTTRCKKCGKEYFPPRADCASCLTSEVEWFEIVGAGKLLSYTKAMYAPLGFEQDVPYVLGVAQFGSVKVFGRLSKSIADADVRVGMDVKAAPLKLPTDRIGYELVKA